MFIVFFLIYIVIMGVGKEFKYLVKVNMIFLVMYFKCILLIYTCIWEKKYILFNKWSCFIVQCILADETGYILAILKGNAMKVVQSIKLRDQLQKTSLIFTNFGVGDNCVRVNNKTKIKLDNKVSVE